MNISFVVFYFLYFNVSWCMEHKMNSELLNSVKKIGKSKEQREFSFHLLFPCVFFFLKDAVRVSKKDFSSERAKMYGPQDLWYHLTCFAENRDELGFGSGASPDRYV